MKSEILEEIRNDVLKLENEVEFVLQRDLVKNKAIVLCITHKKPYVGRYWRCKAEYID